MKEKDFSKMLHAVAEAEQCAYIVIPDLIPQPDRHIPIARKRPFDGILSTPRGNFAVELKIDYRPLKPHQAEALRIVRNINTQSFVFRCIHKRRGMIYRIEHEDREVIFQSENIADCIKFLKGQQVNGSQL